MAIDFKKLEDSPHLLDHLIQCEDVLDSLDVYVARNWFEGEVVAGPMVRRHWTSFSLLYPKDKMPDPKAALRLLKHGVRVDFSKVARAEDDEFRPLDSGNASPVGSSKTRVEEKDAEEAEWFWLVKIDFPRRLLGQMDAAEADYYEDDVEMDDVQDAQDSGINDESAYTEDGQTGEPTEEPMPGDETQEDPNLGTPSR